MPDANGLVTIDDIKDYVAKNPGPYVDPKTGNSLIPPSAFSNSKPTSPVVTTSTPATTNVNNLGNNIAGAAANPPVTTTTANPSGTPAPTPLYTWYDGSKNTTPDPYGFGTSGYNPSSDPRVTTSTTDANTIYQNRETQLQQQRDAEIAALQAKQKVDTANLKQTQASETGTSNRNLTYLQEGGQSASAQAYMDSLDITHQKEMDNLTAQYNSAIQTAQNAFNDKDFALAEAMTKNAKTIKDDALKRNQDFLDYTLKLRTEANTEATLQLNQQKAQQTFNKDNGITGRFYQYPNSSDVYDSLTGKKVTLQEYQSLGGQGGNFGDVQIIDPDANKRSPAYQEWLDYKKTGGTLGFNDYQTMDVNRKAKANAAGDTLGNTLKSVEIEKANQALDEAKKSALKETVPSGILKLARDGKSWAEVAQKVTDMGFDPGEFDDVFHRAYMSTKDYNAWAATQSAAYGKIKTSK